MAAGAGSLSTIAKRYGVSKSSLLRHRDGHGPISARTSPTIAEPATDRCATVVVLDETETLPDHVEGVEPGAARLREVANLLARGMTRAEIAARYHVHVDTVTVWTRTLREKGILRVRATTAEGIIADLLQANAQREQRLWQLAQEARAKGIPRAEVAALVELRKEKQHVFEVVQSLGAFDRYKLVPEKPETTDPESLVDMMQSFAKLLATDFPEEGGQTIDGSIVEPTGEAVETADDNLF